MAKTLLSFVVVALSFVGSCALASPWAEVGDSQLRADIEILASAHVIDGITTHWPLPWRDIAAAISDKDAVEDSDPQVAGAARRVMAKADAQFLDRNANYSIAMDIDTSPSFVRGFDALGREKFQGQAIADYVFGSTALRIAVGAQVKDWRKKADILFDGSFLAHKFGPTIVYLGSITHWWGPGWISALSLSNNARPFPQIGIERAGTSAFKSRWLHWLGPWQAEFFVGLLDGPRIDKNTLYSGLRVTLNPLPGLEIGIARTEEACGTHHACNPLKYYFEFQNDPSHPNHTNDEGLIDIRYSRRAWRTPFEVYVQFMNEDSNPISHSGTSHLVGASVFPRIAGLSGRITAEYTSTIPTLDIFSFHEYIHGFAYNNFSYLDGMRYRGRTLGFSLDSDSRLASLQFALTDQRDWSYTLTLHHARVSTGKNVFNGDGNPLTTEPVSINMIEGRFKIPVARASLEIAARYQDDQLRPKRGSLASIEAALTIGL